MRTCEVLLAGERWHIAFDVVVSFFTCVARSLIELIECSVWCNSQYQISKTESIWVSINSVCNLIAAISLRHIEHKWINVFSPITSTIPFLRCIATTNSSFSCFQDDKSGTFVKYFLIEYCWLPTISWIVVDTFNFEISIRLWEVLNNFICLAYVYNFR